MLKIEGSVKNYAWGGYGYIPLLLGKSFDGKTPYAEVWFGDHKSGPSVLEDGSFLDQVISEKPLENLGEPVCRKYGGRLPFLLKILDVRAPLSIQVHPSKEQAEEGYKREESLSIDPALRNYKDDNHKPELMLALSDFYLLHGFRQRDNALSDLKKFSELDYFARLYEEKSLKDFVEFIFLQDKSLLEEKLRPLFMRLYSDYVNYSLSKTDNFYWFMRAAVQCEEDKRSFDAGLIMTLIMNLMYVKTGDVVFQGSGVPHAYLEGQNIELMANSDNVVRGGLTVKHVDVAELLKITEFNTIDPSTVKPSSVSENCLEYRVPVKDFILREYQLKAGEKLSAPLEKGPCIWLLFSGELEQTGCLSFSKAPDAFFQKPGEKGEFIARTHVRLFRASSEL